MTKNTNKFTDVIISKKIQSINIGILLGCTVISAIATIIPPVDMWLKNNNVYVMVCYILATSIGIMVYSIYEYVCRIKPFGNAYRPVKELGKLLSRLDDDLCVDVYFGLNDAFLLNQLIVFLEQHTSIASKYKVYIEYRLIDSIINENYFLDYHFNLCCNLPKLILVHAKQNDSNDTICNEAQLFFVRCSAENEFEYIAVDSDDEIMLTLTDNFLYQVKSIHLSDSFISKSMRYIFDTKCSTLDNLISNKCLEIYSRDTFFKYMTEILTDFTSNIYAIDFILPHFWLEHNYTQNYGLAHKSVIASVKQRIHIIDLEHIKALSELEKKKIVNDYSKYITFMRDECDVELFFLELSKFDCIKYEKRGSLILDDKCVFVAINPSDGAPMGTIDFNHQQITRYKRRFDDCLKIAQQADRFIQNILLKI